MELRNIGILAHVDTGKTTLTERLLYTAGAIREMGRVDTGTAHSDSLAVEQQRGISVESSLQKLTWKGVRIHLMDTPGHADFAAQVERALWTLDGGVLMVSAAEGVQPYSETLYRALHARGLPALLFLNKIDRPTADPEGVLAEIRERMCPGAFFLSGEMLAPAKGQVSPALYEALADAEETFADSWLEGVPLSAEEGFKALRRLTLAGKLLPVISGSALKGGGAELLLDSILSLFPPPSKGDRGKSGIVFGVREDGQLGRAALVRMFSGSLTPREGLLFREKECKITALREAGPGRNPDIPRLSAGEVGEVYGLPDCRVGDAVGDKSLLPFAMTPGLLSQPLFMLKVEPDKPEELPRLRQALELLQARDPLLGVKWWSFDRTLTVQIMGTIQIDVLSDTLSREFGLQVHFGQPRVMYRETPAGEAVGFCAYTMPKPCWAVLEFHIRPLPRGSGVVYKSLVHPTHLQPRYLRQVEQTLPLALKQGRLGWQVTDCEILLTDGQDHKFHTHPLDFTVATPWALHDGLAKAGSILLEPMLEAEITLPRELAPKLSGLLLRLRGEEHTPVERRGMYTASALLPVAETADLPVQLASLSHGAAQLTTRFAGYRDCPLELGQTAPRRSVDPLDTAKYILTARDALSGGIFGEDW